MTLLNSSNVPGSKKDSIITKKDDTKAKQKDNKELYTKTLSKDKKYIQLGAFNIPYYAEELAERLNKSGFNAKIFQDKDGFYKITIETAEPEKTKKELKDKTGLDSFLRK
jgi:cell division septation protein DedD